VGAPLVNSQGLALVSVQGLTGELAEKLEGFASQGNRIVSVVLKREARILGLSTAWGTQR
jgi:hypothetical protein